MGELPVTYVPGFHDENVLRKLKYNYLGATGMKISELSLGTGGFSYFYGDFSLEDCKKTVHEAIKNGINFIDTGPWYGHGVAEEILGKCLDGIPRKAYYLATKVGRYENEPETMFNFTAEKTRESINTSLSRLNVDYVDLLQVHDIEFAPSLDMVLNETLPAVEEIVKSGKAKHIGITGYPVSVLSECIEKSTVKIETVLSYCRLTLFDESLRQYLPKFQAKNIGIINAAANGMGLLSSAGPQQWHPANKNLKDICTKAREYCNSKNVELGKLAVYYSLQQKGPHTILVGMNNPQLLTYNLDVTLNGLTQKEQETLHYIQNSIFNGLEKIGWEDEVKNVVW